MTEPVNVGNLIAEQLATRVGQLALDNAQLAAQLQVVSQELQSVKAQLDNTADDASTPTS